MAYRYRRRFIRQVAVSGVSGADITQFAVILPSIDEQDAICAAINSATLRIEFEQSKSQKLNMLKRGLMHDLLTGRVRVTAVHDKRAAVME